MSLEAEKQLITEIIDDINESWLFKDFNKVASHLHEDVVFIKGSFRKELKGIKACVGSYQQFMKQASIERYRADQVNISLWDDVANAHYEFAIEYEIGDKIVQEKGVDILTLKKFDGQWKVIWRSAANVQRREMIVEEEGNQPS